MNHISLKYILLIPLLLGCDCFQSVSGTVIDSDTQLALEGVKIVNISSIDTEYLTKQDGYFEKSEIGSGFNCPDIVLRFEKEGYEIDTLFLGTGKEKIVKLKKLLFEIKNE
jgi:hypothetical protein